MILEVRRPERAHGDVLSFTKGIKYGESRRRFDVETHSLAGKDFRRSRNRRFTFAIVERTLDRSGRAQLIQLAALKVREP